MAGAIPHRRSTGGNHAGSGVPPYTPDALTEVHKRRVRAVPPEVLQVFAASVTPFASGTGCQSGLKHGRSSPDANGSNAPQQNGLVRFRAAQKGERGIPVDPTISSNRWPMGFKPSLSLQAIRGGEHGLEMLDG